MWKYKKKLHEVKKFLKLKSYALHNYMYELFWTPLWLRLSLYVQICVYVVQRVVIYGVGISCSLIGWLEGEGSSQISLLPLANAYITFSCPSTLYPSQPLTEAYNKFLTCTDLSSKLSQISNLNYPLIRGYKISQFSSPLIRVYINLSPFLPF